MKSIEGTLLIDMNEHEMKMALKSEETADWFLDLTTAEKKELPFRNISRSKAECNFEGFDYSVKASRGNFESFVTGSGFRIFPKKNQIILNLYR